LLRVGFGGKLVGPRVSVGVRKGDRGSPAVPTRTVKTVQVIAVQSEREGEAVVRVLSHGIDRSEYAGGKTGAFNLMDKQGIVSGEGGKYRQ
jgi:hypothetical protein